MVWGGLILARGLEHIKAIDGIEVNGVLNIGCSDTLPGGRGGLIIMVYNLSAVADGWTARLP